MNVVLWIIAGLLAVAFLGAGAMKVSQSKEKLGGGMAWTEDFSAGAIKAIGSAEVLGAIGLIVPAVTNIAPVLVPIAATALAVLMLGAAATHLRRHEPQMIVTNLVLAALAIVVAWGRFGSYQFGS